MRTVSDILFFTKQYRLPGILLNIDFEKAYDSVDHKYLFKVLDTFSLELNFKNGSRCFILIFLVML